MHVYLIPSFITGVVTFSWYTIYGFDFIRSVQKPKPKHHDVPEYMWDIYKNGYKNDADVVRGVTPKFLGPFFRSRTHPNHLKQEMEFAVPEPGEGEALVAAEIRVATRDIRGTNVSLQLYRKDINWVYLDAKPVREDWISLKVTPGVTEFNGRMSFLMLSVFRGRGCEVARLMRPVLLLSYNSSVPRVSDSGRRRRDVGDDYEEETNRIWRHKSRNTCRRKSLYIEFSEIDYDTWIVAPTGYEAFQCVGKCTFPVGENLSPTKHAILQTLLHHVSPTKASRACCVPTRLEPISVLYVDSKGILTYRLHYNDMVVAECGCR